MTIIDTLIFLALFGTFIKLYCVDRIDGKPIVSYTDLRSRTIISLYIIGFFMSATNWALFTIANIEDNEKSLFQNIVEFVDLITVDMVFLNLQIIVFEMLSLYITFTSTTNEENSRK
jgi:L-cystine uptake protein TcyP (sodium:dicarboxylate symporter family)